MVINHPGAGKPEIAKVGVTPEELDRVPELADSYPEFHVSRNFQRGASIFDMLSELFRECYIYCPKKDYRPAIILDDAHHVSMSKMKIQEPGKRSNRYIYINLLISLNKITMKQLLTTLLLFGVSIFCTANI